MWQEIGEASMTVQIGSISIDPHNLLKLTAFVKAGVFIVYCLLYSMCSRDAYCKVMTALLYMLAACPGSLR